jgi:hypothetical protein
MVSLMNKASIAKDMGHPFSWVHALEVAKRYENVSEDDIGHWAGGDLSQFLSRGLGKVVAW